jgi:hypothetical protein
MAMALGVAFSERVVSYVVLSRLSVASRCRSPSQGHAMGERAPARVL